MIIFNDTIIIEEEVEQQWLKYMKDVHIPAVMATGYFNSYQVLTVIDSPNEGVTYCIQYSTDNLESFDKFYSTHFHTLMDKHNKAFEERFVLFNTLMKTVD